MIVDPQPTLFYFYVVFIGLSVLASCCFKSASVLSDGNVNGFGKGHGIWKKERGGSAGLDWQRWGPVGKDTVDLLLVLEYEGRARP